MLSKLVKAANNSIILFKTLNINSYGCFINPNFRYITSCAAVASSDLDHNTKLKYFNKFIDSLNNIEQG